MPHKRRSLSSTMSTIILVALVIVSGLAVFGVFQNVLNVEWRRVQVVVENIRLHREGARALFAIVLKNAGSKEIILLQVKLHNESAYVLPSVSSSNSLLPGKSASALLQDPQLHPQYYIVGNVYLVEVFAQASDGSSFSTIVSVTCTGLAWGAESGGGQRGGGSAEHALIITLIGSGSILINGEMISTNTTLLFAEGSLVQADASINPPGGFDRWVIDGVENRSQRLSFHMDGAHFLTAIFNELNLITLAGSFSTVSGTTFENYNGADTFTNVNFSPYYNGHDIYTRINFSPYYGGYDVVLP